MWWIFPTIILGLMVLWLVIAKPVTRICRYLGIRTPCPFWLGWILLLRPGRWFRNRILDRIDIQPGEHVLEIGCGVGVFTIEAARRTLPGGSLTGVDIQPAMIASVQRKLSNHPDLPVQLLCDDACKLPFNTNTIDRIFLVSALPEMPNKDQVLIEAHRVLKPRGTLSITEEFFDPEYRLPREHIKRAERNGFQLQHRQGSWLMYTLNFVSI